MRIMIEDLSPEVLDRIEERMRPGGSSASGFLAHDEGLTEIVRRDRAALAELSITPEQIGDRLESIVGQAFRFHELAVRGTLELPPGSKECSQGVCSNIIEQRYELSKISCFLGIQICPFENSQEKICPGGTWPAMDFTLRNRETGEVLSFPGMAVHLIRDHHFFEGAVHYRVDPLRAVKVLQLRPGVDYRRK